MFLARMNKGKWPKQRKSPFVSVRSEECAMALRVAELLLNFKLSRDPENFEEVV